MSKSTKNKTQKKLMSLKKFKNDLLMSQWELINLKNVKFKPDLKVNDQKITELQNEQV